MSAAAAPAVESSVLDLWRAHHSPGLGDSVDAEGLDAQPAPTVLEYSPSLGFVMNEVERCRANPTARGPAAQPVPPSASPPSMAPAPPGAPMDLLELASSRTAEDLLALAAGDAPDLLTLAGL